jgi:hypothetical protein
MELEKVNYLELLKEEHFKDAPLTTESHGVYQFIKIEGKLYFRDIETGEIHD